MVESNNAINNTVGASITGVTNTLTVTNPSDTASSAARASISVGGGSAADPTLNFNVTGTQDFEMGIDNNDSDALVIANTTSLGTGNTWRMSTAGERTMPLQPAFTAIVSGAQNNVTGDSTTYTVQFGNVLVDQNSDYDGTSTFTAPVTGIYSFGVNVGVDNLTSSFHTMFITLVTTGQSYNLWNGNPGRLRDNVNVVHAGNNLIVPLTALDTVHVAVTVQGGSKTVGVRNIPNTFSGCLLA